MAINEKRSDLTDRHNWPASRGAGRSNVFGRHGDRHDCFILHTLLALINRYKLSDNLNN